MFSQIATLALAAALLLGQTAPQGPVAVAAPSYTHVGRTPPPHGYPQIRGVSISTRDMHAGEQVSGQVETSPNVGYVEARIEFRNIALQRVGAGRFALQYTVPWWLPPWLRHGYTLQIIARSIDGVETMHPIPITIH
ncbi:MAG: hypothetical protein ABI186_11105 [Candidatus Elarobacter sp.]